jgi:hypothetical protein
MNTHVNQHAIASKNSTRNYACIMKLSKQYQDTSVSVIELLPSTQRAIHGQDTSQLILKGLLAHDRACRVRSLQDDLTLVSSIHSLVGRTEELARSK